MPRPAPPRVGVRPAPPDLASPRADFPGPLRLAALLLLSVLGLAPGVGEAGSLVAQSSTDVVVLDLYPHLDHVHVSSLTRVTDRTGYDNQPRFLDHERLLFVSDRDGGTEVYLALLAEDRVVRLTDTPESEYSPHLLRWGADGAEALVVVRVEADGVSQHLVRYPLPVRSSPESLEEPLREGIRLAAPLLDVGYHAWAPPEEGGDAGEARWGVLFRVGAGGAPPTLYRIRLDAAGRMTEEHRVQAGIGRSLQPVPGTTEVSFVDLSTPDRPILQRLDPASGEVTRVAELPAGADEHGWLSAVTVFFPHDGVLWRSSREPERPWIPLMSFEEELGAVLGGRVTRIAVSPAGLRVAVVVERPE